MLGLYLGLALAAAVPVETPTHDLAVVRDISQLEQRWGEAFIKRDFAFIERVVAPEYKLSLVSNDGMVTLVDRATWMRNSRAWEHRGMELRVVDVATAGQTAVATVQGLWTVKKDAGPAQALRFLVTDTWVKRNGQWQVMWRYSHRLPQAAWPPAAKVESAVRPSIKAQQ